VLSPFQSELATPLELPSAAQADHIQRLKLACVAVVSSYAEGPVAIVATRNPGSVVHAMQITAPKGAPRLVLAAAVWLSDIRDCQRVTHLLEVCDLCLAARVGMQQIDVSVDVATKAIAAAARRLDVALVPHQTLMARIAQEVR
jgi:hypothetical protein